jgi:TctA family transporter
MILGRGDPSIFVTRPISAALLAAAAAAIVIAVLPAIRAKREKVFQEED